MASEGKHSEWNEELKLKGIGMHWFLDIGGKLKLLSILDNAQNVRIENNVIFAGEELYQVSKSDDGDFFVSEIETVRTSSNTPGKIKRVSTSSDIDKSSNGESLESAESVSNNVGTSDKSGTVVNEIDDVCRTSALSDTETSGEKNVSGRKKGERNIIPEESAPNELSSSDKKNSSENPGPTLVSAMFNFEAFLDDEISFQKNAKFKIHREGNSSTREWFFAEHLSTGKKGYIPRACVSKTMPSLEVQDWWFTVDRKAAENLLLSQNFLPGTFLVRPYNDKDSFSLSVRDDFDQTVNYARVKHYRIGRLENGGLFINPKRTFENMLDLVFHYQNAADGLCCKLSMPCPKVRPLEQLKKLEVSRDSVKCLRRLGSGAFGHMYAGKLRNTVDVLVKTLKQGKMTADDFLVEAEVLQHLRHEKLVRLLAVCTKSEPIFIITELMISGSLLIHLRKDKGKTITFLELVNMGAQIADGMAYLEAKKCIHRDLRAANILVNAQNEVKVANFNLACFIVDGTYKAPENAKFPLKWTAPEAINDRTFSIKSDVWSFGVLLYELITFGGIPYPEMRGTEVLDRLMKGFRMPKPTDGPVSCPEPFYDTMLNSWHRDPDSRPTFEYLQDFFYNYSVSTETAYWPIVTDENKR